MVFLTSFNSEETSVIPLLTGSLLLFFSSNTVLVTSLMALYIASAVLVNTGTDILEDYLDDGEGSQGGDDYIIGFVVLLTAGGVDLYDDKLVSFLLKIVGIGALLGIVLNFTLLLYAIF